MFSSVAYKEGFSFVVGVLVALVAAIISMAVIGICHIYGCQEQGSTDYGACPFWVISNILELRSSLERSSIMLSASSIISAGLFYTKTSR